MSVVVQEWCIVDDGWRQPWRLQCSTSMFEKPRNQRQRGLLELIWPGGLASMRVRSRESVMDGCSHHCDA